MQNIKQFIQKNTKFNFYLKKYALEPISGQKGVFYILKRKGLIRFNLGDLQTHQEYLNNWDYWERIINGSGNSQHQIEKSRHEKNQFLFNFSNAQEIELKPAHKFAIEHAKGKVLDLGCFDGKLLCWLGRNSYDCFGMDFDNHYLDTAINNFKNAGGNEKNIKKGLFQNIPFSDGYFDTVISLETLEHFCFPELVMGEIKRVLRTGGKFIGSVPLENRIDAPSHIVYYTFSGLREMLSKHFNIREIIASKSRPTFKTDNQILWMAEK